MNADDGDDVYNWPWLYGVEVGHWDLTDEQARNCAITCCAADFSCATIFTARSEWAVFVASMKSVFPGPPHRGDSQTAIPSFTLSTIWTIVTKCLARSLFIRIARLRKRRLSKQVARHLRR